MKDFKKFPSIGRLNKKMTITEKIDGTNAQLYINSEPLMQAGSRKRWIYPEGTTGEPKGCDNFGFAGWADKHEFKLMAFLGEGIHFGEWCGPGIQRNYGLDHKRFYLFNSGRWQNTDIPFDLYDAGLRIVPVLYEGDYSTDMIRFTMEQLHDRGSRVNHFNKPEGVVVFHHGTRTLAKATFDFDMGKWSANQ